VNDGPRFGIGVALFVFGTQLVRNHAHAYSPRLRRKATDWFISMPRRRPFIIMPSIRMVDRKDGVVHFALHDPVSVSASLPGTQ
jgi:hypothetical protein